MAEKKPTKHYINNEEFYQAIVAHREKVKEAVKEGKIEPRLSNYLGECIYKIANNLSYSPKFINYSYRDEMVAEAIKNSIQYFNSYDPEYISKNGRINPFTYFTQIAYNAFIYVINKEEDIRYIRCKNFDNTMMQNGNMDLLVDDENNLLPSSTYDNISEFIEKYEQKQRDKKEKRRIKKEEKAKEIINE